LPLELPLKMIVIGQPLLAIQPEDIPPIRNPQQFKE